MKQSFQSFSPAGDPPVRAASRGNLTLLTVSALGLCALIAALVIPRGADAPGTAAPLTSVVPAAETPSPHAPITAAAPDPALQEEEIVARAITLPMSKTGHGAVSLQLNTGQTPDDLSSINANALVSPKFASFSDVFTPLDRVTSATIKDQLRAPTRLLATNTQKPSISSLTDHSMTLLCPFGSKADPRLKALVEDAVFQRQSNDYIATLVNTTAQRDSLRVPASLRTTRGDWDTSVLLKGMAQIAGGAVDSAWTPRAAQSTHIIQEGDSLAGLSMQAFGHPFHYKAILEANPHIDKMKPVLVPGESLVIPAQ